MSIDEMERKLERAALKQEYMTTICHRYTKQFGDKEIKVVVPSITDYDECDSVAMFTPSLQAAYHRAI